VKTLEGFEGTLPADTLPGAFAVLQSNRLIVHRTLEHIGAGLQHILDEEEEDKAATGCLGKLSYFCRYV